MSWKVHVVDNWQSMNLQVYIFFIEGNHIYLQQQEDTIIELDRNVSMEEQKPTFTIRAEWHAELIDALNPNQPKMDNKLLSILDSERERVDKMLNNLLGL